MDRQHIQSRLLELLTRFDSLCSEQNIAYTLHGGTLLGAVRNGGFIPWDDDADVAMTRTEFRKLYDHLRKEDSAFFITERIKTQFRSKDDPEIWIDIFICDPISEHPFAQKLKLLLLTALDIMSKNNHSKNLSNIRNYSLIKQTAFHCLYILGKPISARRKAKWYNCIAQTWLNGSGTLFFRSNDQYVGRKLPFPADWMDHFENIQFEGRTFRTQRDYNALLTSCYGPDYMIPRRDDHAHRVHMLVRSDSEHVC